MTNAPHCCTRITGRSGQAPAFGVWGPSSCHQYEVRWNQRKGPKKDQCPFERGPCQAPRLFEGAYRHTNFLTSNLQNLERDFRAQASASKALLKPCTPPFRHERAGVNSIGSYNKYMCLNSYICRYVYAFPEAPST